MAEAPLPGVGARMEQRDAAQRLLKITVKGVAYKIAPANVPLDEQDVFMRATGHSIEYIGGGERFGELAIAQIWWLARRLAGESDLTWTQAKGEWPTDIGPGDLDLEEVTADEGNDPEA